MDNWWIIQLRLMISVSRGSRSFEGTRSHHDMGVKSWQRLLYVLDHHRVKISKSGLLKAVNDVDNHGKIPKFTGTRPKSGEHPASLLHLTGRVDFIQR
jgi:hypothetical protein